MLEVCLLILLKIIRKSWEVLPSLSKLASKLSGVYLDLQDNLRSYSFAFLALLSSQDASSRWIQREIRNAFWNGPEGSGKEKKQP